jgi:CRP-like cAMP-binding protein
MLREMLVSKGSSGRQIQDVMNFGSWMEVPPRARLFHQNDPVPYLALIESGRVDLLMRNPSLRDPVRVASLGEGQVIGWELLVGAPRCTFDVETVTRTRLLVVPAEQLAVLREHEPQAAVHLLDLALTTMQAVRKAGHDLPCCAGTPLDRPSA